MSGNDRSNERSDTAATTAELERRAYELATLNAIAQELNRSIELNVALQSTLAQAADLLGLQTGWIWLLNEGGQTSYLAAWQNLPPVLVDNPGRMGGSCYCLDSYYAGDMDGAANINVVTCSRLKNVVEGADGLRYHASVPLYAHGKQLGVLNVAGADWQELSDDDLRLLHTIGDMLSIAIERARLFSQSVELGAVNERNRLAREIHDTLAQGLSAVLLQLETVDALLDGEVDRADERLKRAVSKALVLTRDNLDEARRSVHDLRATPLEGRSLAAALEELVLEMRERCSLDARLTVTGPDQPLPVAVEAGLYRMAQEALNNVTNHAEATAVTVALTSTPQQVDLIVEDDGVGFDPAQTSISRYGLLGMNERVRLLGGSLRIESSPGAGARVSVSVPFDSKDEVRDKQ